jgi:predicted XRE-type DNA-binding protein
MIDLSQKLRAKGYSQAQAAKVLGVTQPRISDLQCGRINLFSTDTLINMLSALNIEVEVRLKESVPPRAGSKKLSGTALLA